MSDNHDQTDSYILFKLARTTYAVQSQFVQQLEMVEQITPIPQAQAFVEGVVFLRGQVIPALNLRVRFGFEKIPYDLSTRLVVINTGGRILGLIVDTAREFVRIPADSISPPNEAIAGLSGQYLEGIAMLGERIVLILSLAEVMNSVASVQAMIGSQPPALGAPLEPGMRPALNA
jgi:purine-binding chemotaxis protein CheW